MSWAMSVPAVPFSEFASAVENAEIQGPETDEHVHQSRAVRDAVHALVNNGALGGDEEGLLVSLSANGHANEGHRVVDGYSDSTLHLSITRSKPEGWTAAPPSAESASASEESDPISEARVEDGVVGQVDDPEGETSDEDDLDDEIEDDEDEDDSDEDAEDGEDA